MFHRFLNWRFTLFAIAIAIVTGTIFYSQYLARKIANDERQKVEIWVESEQFLINSPADADTRLVSTIIINNRDIPIIGVNESGEIIAYINLDSNKIREDPAYLTKKLRQFKSQHDPIVYTDPLNKKKDFYYYGSSMLLREVRYYPLVQLIV
ncbi:MAG: sensor histidine kinase, partial [Chitinophagaceae bacterium]|nr:sensor histidine kinase [Chitinophagaceae bacterium]